ncbi:S8 family peptidase [Bifidobacterium sp. ESL0769]|uniref:S8 family peptidase n=1 Tax=Bifidobacterium sp. ESL0769 TaxID=2983229 RepID=UPI0023F74C2D|nr:S8 family peptidase [Bifidobacterium sp. ESL0769]WEV67907.1 S8 family peptidase [Bifidobacterium sp. ESL0769]
MTRRYLIGRGERLTDTVKVPPGGRPKKGPYDYEESRERLLPELAETIDSFVQDKAYAPNDVHVVQFILHPAYLAKSYHPSSLIRSFGLVMAGSKPVEITTQDDSETQKRLTSSLLLAGGKNAFRSFLSALQETKNPEDGEAIDEIRKIETIKSFSSADKLHEGQNNQDWYELVLQTFEGSFCQDNWNLLRKTATSLNITFDEDLIFTARNLQFIPAHGSKKAMEQLSLYTTLRAVRPMPKLRLEPIGNGPIRAVDNVQVDLPDFQMGNGDEPSVAVFDGGLPEESENPMRDWTDYSLANPVANTVPEYAKHGLAVCSALAFGDIRGQIEPLHTKISAVRVLDSTSADDNPLTLCSVLNNIVAELQERHYDYVNLSLGPDVPIEDDDVSAWTAMLDDLLSSGDTLMTVAAGNNGHLDRDIGNARVEIPGDSVNALCVGSSTSEDFAYERASYSAVGPGRRPGLIKPDLLAFGGIPDNEFHVLSSGTTPRITTTMGTSFAAPMVLRKAVQICELSGRNLTPLAIKALLIHTAEKEDGAEIEEVGWGRVMPDAESILASEGENATVVYQGSLSPGKYLRARIPVPKDLYGARGKADITATFTFASRVDPQCPDVYTQSGLIVTFRPSMEAREDGKIPKSIPFFTSQKYETENDQRNRRYKWETVLHDHKSVFYLDLYKPVFDIHYVSREEGAQSSSTEPIHYALAITLHVRNSRDLTGQILHQYPELEEFIPVEGLTAE